MSMEVVAGSLLGDLLLAEGVNGQPGEGAFVAYGATVVSTDYCGIRGDGFGHHIEIRGGVFGGRGIQLGDFADAAFGDHSQHVVIHAEGLVRGTTDDAIRISGRESIVVNAGRIQAQSDGISPGCANLATTTSYISNSGLIKASNYGINLHAGADAKRYENTSILNTGIIEGGDLSLRCSDKTFGATKLSNIGLMRGDVEFGPGDDWYDGRSGTIVGSVRGRDGSDTILGGQERNLIQADGGNDVVDGGGGIDDLFGGDGKDGLSGGLGLDKLTGGAHADKFIFNLKAQAASRDTIADFKHLLDDIVLDNTFFKVGNPGALKVAAFYTGAKAHDADDRIIYNKKTGALSYDADGTGKIAQVQFATVMFDGKPVPNLSAADFLIV